MPRKTRKRLRSVLMLLALTGIAGVGALGWNWLNGIPVRQIEVTGAAHADPAALIELARVDTGKVLFDLEPDLLADRLLQHPWVASADVVRMPTGTLSLRVSERTPVALVLDASGSPSGYLDRAGFSMPLVEGAVYDVPLLRGLAVPAGWQPVEDHTVRALLEALATTDAAVDALISEVELRDGEAWVITAPAGSRGAIPVRLGRSAFGEKLQRLGAFWKQAVLSQPDKRFDMVDLRFDSQVVTREESIRRQ